MESFLSVTTGKLSLSCGDLRDEPEYPDIKRLRAHSNGSVSFRLERSWTRFLRPKSAGSIDRSAKNRPRSPGAEVVVNNIDHLLADIKERLAVFRKQDEEFHERMDSLSNSIGELASRSSVSLTPKSPSEVSVASDVTIYSDDISEENYENDQVIINEIGNISASFSTEVLNCIPTIKVTACCKRRLSDTTIHEPVGRKLSQERHSISVPDHTSLWSNDDGVPVSTLL